jgi:hypothetical protein
MEKTIQEKLDHYRRIAERSAGQESKSNTAGQPDSLSTVIRTKRDADMFMAQLDAVAKLAREEYLEVQKTASDNSL